MRIRFSRPLGGARFSRPLGGARFSRPLGGARFSRPLGGAIVGGAAVFGVATLDLAVLDPAWAAKPTRFWNLTEATVTKLELAPAGTERWGADQAKNDKDGTVEHDERVKIIGAAPGRYDVRLADSKGRNCVVRNVEIKDGEVFSIEEKQLADSCAK